MAESRGKQFEKEVYRALKEVNGLSIDRLADPMGGYAGQQNICDFIVYQYPFQYYFECKERSGNTLNFKSDITTTQWEGLLEKSKKYGVIAGVLVWFIDHDINAFVPITALESMKCKGMKSLHVNDVKNDDVSHVKLPGLKKRILFSYDGPFFMFKMKNYADLIQDVDILLRDEVVLNGKE